MFKNIRKGKDREKLTVALTSVFAAVFLTVVKLAVGIVSGSLGVLAEAAHSAMDLAAALVTFFAVKTASRPPDQQHQFGHEKVENLSALFETFLLILTCIWISYEAVEKLLGDASPIRHPGLTFGVMILSIIIDSGRSRVLMKAAKKYHSQALEADALHFRSDILSSMVVIVGLAGAYLGAPWADPLAAFIVSLIVLKVSIKLGRECIDALMDKAPEGIDDRIRTILEECDEDVHFKRVRVRAAGPKKFIDLVINVNRLMPLEKVDELSHRLQERIEQEVPGADMIIHPDPYQNEKERIVDMLRLRAVELDMNVHHVIITRLDRGHLVEFHLECPPEMRLDAAYRVSNQLKKQLYKDLPDIVDINIHLEEIYYDYRDGKYVDEANAGYRDKIIALAKQQDGIVNCHDVVFVQMDDGTTSVSLDCVLDGGRLIHDIHTVVSRLENQIKQQFPKFKRVLIHSEPLQDENRDEN
jgi:cation diffusion facilitator family transporter